MSDYTGDSGSDSGSDGELERRWKEAESADRSEYAGFGEFWGWLGGRSDWCIVSWPAYLGCSEEMERINPAKYEEHRWRAREAWRNLQDEGYVSTTCCYTGPLDPDLTDQKKQDAWFKPWKKNVDEAIKKRKRFVFIWNDDEDSLGDGQSLKRDHLDNLVRQGMIREYRIYFWSDALLSRGGWGMSFGQLLEPEWAKDSKVHVVNKAFLS